MKHLHDRLIASALAWQTKFPRPELKVDPELHRLWMSISALPGADAPENAADASIEECEDNACAGCAWCDQPTEQPRAPMRRPLNPCCDGCPGWAIFDVNRCTVHGDDCDCCLDDCSTDEIQRCDECWSGEADAPDDDYFAAQPEAQERLRLSSDFVTPTAETKNPC